jgi:glyoxylate carboligase
MGTQKTRGAEILLEILRSEGTRYIFGNPGTTELPLIDALVVNPDFRYVWGLQEATVVSMADGYAQASGKTGFCESAYFRRAGARDGADHEREDRQGADGDHGGSTGSAPYSG